MDGFIVYDIKLQKISDILEYSSNISLIIKLNKYFYSKGKSSASLDPSKELCTFV